MPYDASAVDATCSLRLLLILAVIVACDGTAERRYAAADMATPRLLRVDMKIRH